MARAATSPELALFRTQGQWSKLRAGIFQPSTIYTARINQTFTTTDGVLEITYDTGSGTLANVLPDMTLLVGSTAGAHDVGICRIRSADVTKFYISETADVEWADNLYLTAINDYCLWAKHVLIDDGTAYMDGGIAYSDQHSAFDPTPIMGGHRVLKLTGATVSASFDGASSYVIDGSAIASRFWSAPGSSSSSGMTGNTPTITWNAPGWYAVYLTLVAANGKSFFGVRYVYVWDEDHQPASASIEDCRQDAETGGWQFQITLYDNVTLADVRDRSLVILFGEEYYGTTAQSIGPLAGSENILVAGWIGEEEIAWNPNAGQVQFTAYTAQYWLTQIPAFPDGVEFVSGTPAAWTEMQNLTVDLGLWHFLHWRTTATRVMDVRLTGDTRISPEVSSLASNLWEQLREMAFLQIFARPGVNAHNQLFVEVHPQLVPAASRTWPTVMTITKPDWEGEITFDRVIVPPVAIVNLSGIAVNSSGVGTPFFSLSPGHAYPHYGSLEIVDRVLVSTQAQSNELAGLYRAWQNNPYPNIPVSLVANNRLIDCFPRQKCAISIASGDTPRGITYSGGLIPTAVAYVSDPRSGYVHTEVTFEAETSADASVDGDVPGSDDRSTPPTPPFPPLPDFPVIIPGGLPPGTDGGPKTVVIHDTGYGLLYTDTFNTTPNWISFNAGLTATQYRSVNLFFRTPNGACYCGYVGGGNTAASGDYFFARAPSLGATWTILFQSANLWGGSGRWSIEGASYNPLASETVGVILQSTADGGPWLYVGSNLTWVKGAAAEASGYFYRINLSYGFGKWLSSTYANIRTYSADGGTVTPISTPYSAMNPSHIRASSTGRTFHTRASGGLIIGDDNFATSFENTDTDIGPGGDDSNPYIACDPTGALCMSRYTTGARAKSNDGGYSWVLMTNLPLGGYWFAYAGGGGSTSRWLAAGATMIYYSDDFGNSWAAKLGNLWSQIPVPQLNMVKVLEY